MEDGANGGEKSIPGVGGAVEIREDVREEECSSELVMRHVLATRARTTPCARCADIIVSAVSRTTPFPTAGVCRANFSSAAGA